MVYDPQTGDTLYDQNSQKYFTPASNTKIFTLYTALELLPERVPALRYLSQNDTLYIEGTGNPSTLHPYLKDSVPITLLGNASHVALYYNNFKDSPYGPGWAWEDYDSAYSPERSALPLYGNVVSVYYKDSLVVSPLLFRDSITQISHHRNREATGNRFYFDPSRRDTLEIPFITDSSMTRKLLEEILQRKVAVINKMPPGPKSTLWGIHTDSLYKRMMHQSDNFIAEQLLVLATATLSDTLNGSTAREHILSNQLANLQQAPRWVDGSGLSRYNLFSPASMVAVLNRLLLQVPRERLFHLFPTGGETGTLKKWFAGDPEPYIHAKSGSLGNNYCLSGYLVTRSGKTLIFSFMNNHFTLPNVTVKQQMEVVLQQFRDRY
jgi:D-alanyl-D-alanine carboxypeptidase/D-alanyl-D-alanine-endopeptidase (penicillin-binding protein 4)